ncbi:MAG: hypothetical protein V2A58_11385 [Planctomycetota bacterium]
MMHRYRLLYNSKRASKGQALRLDRDGNLVGRLRLGKGVHRFLFEAARGTFDPSVMFFNVYGVRVGPSTQFFRVPGFSDASEKTRYLRESWVGPMVDVYLDGNYTGSALTDFPSLTEFERGFHFGECALPFEGRAHEVRFVNGRGYRLKLLRVLTRPDERPPRRHVHLKASLAGKHPRLYFTSREELRRRATEVSPDRWKHFRRFAEARMEEIRKGAKPESADALPLALYYLVTGEKSYYEAAFHGLCDLLTHGMPGPEQGKMMYRGYEWTEPGTLVEVASVFYDWCHEEMGEHWRALVRESIARVMRWWMPYIRFNTLEWPGNPGGLGHSAYNYHGLGLAGLAFHGEAPEAQEWLDWAVRHFEIARARMAADGSKGIFVHEHCYQAVFHFAAALDHATGTNLLRGWRFFDNHPAHRIARETVSMEYAGENHREYSPNFIAWEALAALTGNPKAQWLAERYMTKALLPGRVGSKHGKNSPLVAFLWRFLLHDPSVRAEADFERMPLDRCDRDTGIVTLRSAWLREDEAIVTFLSGTEKGRVVHALEHRVSAADYPAANSVTLSAYGEGLVTYPMGCYRQHTADHNTLTVEGKGQIQEGTVFGCRASPSQLGKIVGFHSGRAIAFAAGEAAQCYESDVGVKRFTRNVIHIKPHVVLVFDEVDLDRMRAAATHYTFCIVEPTANIRPHPRHRLTLPRENLARYVGSTAGGVAYVPRGLGAHLTIERLKLPRGYVDQDSLFERLTIAAAKARKHRFLTVFLPLADRTQRTLPRIEERSDDEAIELTIKRPDAEVIVILPRSRRTVEWNGVRFAGRLFVGKREGGILTALCALGTRLLEAQGIRRRGRGRNLFGEVMDGTWRFRERR